MIFNSYVVFNKEGDLIAHGRTTKGTPDDYFNHLTSDIQRQAHVLLVLQEHNYVVRYKVVHPNVPAPILGPRETLDGQ